MARALDFVLSEIVRVADILGVHPEEQAFTRTKFLEQAEVTKHDLETYGGFARLKRDACTTHGVEPFKRQAEARGVELRNNYVRKLERQAAESTYLYDRLSESVASVFEKNPIPQSTKVLDPKSHKKPTKRLITLLLSDLHFGVTVDPREVLRSEFGWTIAARRLAKCCEQAATYKLQHRNDTELRVVLNGDIIHGIIHLSEANLRPLTEQIYGATSALVQALDYLRKHFKKVSVTCLPGNHDRVTYRDSGRQLSQRWDSHSHAVFLGLKCAFRNDPTVEFDIPMSGMGTYKTPGGHLVFASHGDAEPSVGNVGKALNVSSVTNNLLKMHAGDPFGQKVDVALFGHWHTPSVFMLQDGTVCIVNGGLLGSDPYAQNGVGFFNSMPAQVLFESVPGHPVGDHRIIQLRDADQDSSYDAIISLPTKGGLDFSF